MRRWRAADKGIRLAFENCPMGGDWRRGGYNIAHNPAVSFCVVGNTNVLPDKFGTEYESTVVFGRASEVNGAEKHDALLWLLEKYCSDFIEDGKHYIEQKDKITKVFKIEIDRISGKARR